MSLSVWDEFLLHQVAAPFAQVGPSDHRFMDRFYFNAHDRSGEVMLVTGCGSYPNTNVMDGHAAVIYRGAQHNLRISRELDHDRWRTVLGPLSFEVVEGLKRWRLRLEPNEASGIRFDLTFDGRFPVYECKTRVARQKHRLAMENCHYVQSGSYAGTLTLGERTWTLDGDWFGQRDRSWGVRGATPGAAPGWDPADRPFGMHLWLPAQFRTWSCFVWMFESADGEALHLDGYVVEASGRMTPVVAVEHDIAWHPETRVHQSGRLVYTLADGRRIELLSRQLQPGLFLKGSGYEPLQGTYRGPLHIEGDEWTLTDDFIREHLYLGTYDQLVEWRCGDDVGYGIFEDGLSPDHTRYGFSVEQRSS